MCRKLDILSDMFLENPRQSKICNIVERKEMLGGGTGGGIVTQIGLAQFFQSVLLKSQI